MPQSLRFSYERATNAMPATIIVIPTIRARLRFSWKRTWPSSAVSTKLIPTKGYACDSSVRASTPNHSTVPNPYNDSPPITPGLKRIEASVPTPMPSFNQPCVRTEVTPHLNRTWARAENVTLVRMRLPP
jgi:hypothetical protein